MSILMAFLKFISNHSKLGYFVLILQSTLKKNVANLKQSIMNFHKFVHTIYFFMLIPQKIPNSSQPFGSSKTMALPNWSKL